MLVPYLPVSVSYRTCTFSRSLNKEPLRYRNGTDYHRIVLSHEYYAVGAKGTFIYLKSWYRTGTVLVRSFILIYFFLWLIGVFLIPLSSSEIDPFLSVSVIEEIIQAVNFVAGDRRFRGILLTGTRTFSVGNRTPYLETGHWCGSERTLFISGSDPNLWNFLKVKAWTVVKKLFFLDWNSLLNQF